MCTMVICNSVHACCYHAQRVCPPASLDRSHAISVRAVCYPLTMVVKICQEERQRVVSNMRILRFDNAVKSLGPATQRQLFQAQGYKD